MYSRHGSLESSILNTLWELEKGKNYTNSVKDVYNLLSNKDKEARAYTTIKTVMDRLTEKKILLKFKQNGKFYYRSAYSKDEIILKSLAQIAQRYCENDFSKLEEILDTLKVREYTSV